MAVRAVFPYLLRVGERSGQPGRVVGRLSALKTAGAIVGSLVTGFVLLGAHHQAALPQLRQGGVYVQWIPLYQVTSVEFWTITRTFSR